MRFTASRGIYTETPKIAVNPRRGNQKPTFGLTIGQDKHGGKG